METARHGRQRDKRQETRDKETQGHATLGTIKVWSTSIWVYAQTHHIIHTALTHTYKYKDKTVLMV